MLNHPHTLHPGTIVPLRAENAKGLAKTAQIVPLIDIQHEDVAYAYYKGLQSSLQVAQGLLPASYLVNFLHSAIECNWFDQGHEPQLRRSVGSILGQIHGRVLTPEGKGRSEMTTLVALDQRDEQRGYRAGRYWFFYEAAADERILTDDMLIQRLHEYVADSLIWGDPEGVWCYTIACLLGELSGLPFPLTPQEQQAWEAEQRYWREKLARE